jgi:ATP-dependent Clp protease, protease subunit
MLSMNAPPRTPIHWVIGFNWIIDRVSTQRLLTAVGAALERGARHVTLCISSVGGAPEQALYAYEILRALPSEVELTTHNVATVQSAAMILFLAGSKRLAVPNATFLMHKTTHNPGTAVGAEHLSYGADSVRADDTSAMAIVADRTGRDLNTVRKWFRGQKIRDTTFAKGEGIITEVIPVNFPEQAQFFQVVGV